MASAAAFFVEGFSKVATVTAIDQRERINSKIEAIERVLSRHIKSRTAFSCRISISAQNANAQFLRFQERLNSVKSQPLECIAVGIEETLGLFGRHFLDELSHTDFFNASIEIAFDGSRITYDPVVIERSYNLSTS